MSVHQWIVEKRLARKIDCDNPSPELLADRNKAGVAPTRSINEMGPKEWVTDKQTLAYATTEGRAGYVQLYKVCLKDFERGKWSWVRVRVLGADR
jgi:hypothetical protein